MQRIKNSVNAWFRRRRKLNPMEFAILAAFGPTSKIVQICDVGGNLSVLCEDGTVWMKRETLRNETWTKET